MLLEWSSRGQALEGSCRGEPPICRDARSDHPEPLFYQAILDPAPLPPERKWLPSLYDTTRLDAACGAKSFRKLTLRAPAVPTPVPQRTILPRFTAKSS